VLIAQNTKTVDCISSSVPTYTCFFTVYSVNNWNDKFWSRIFSTCDSNTFTCMRKPLMKLCTDDSNDTNCMC